MLNYDTPILNIFFKTSKKVFKILFSELEDIKLHPGQPPILLLLLNQNNLTQIDIANKVCVKPSTIAIMLRKMEKNGLIEKKIDKKDRRVFYICLTEKGKLLAEKTKQIMKEVESKITYQLKDDEKNNLIEILSKILIQIDKIKDRYKSN